MEHVTSAVKLHFKIVTHELLLFKIWLMVRYVEATYTEWKFKIFLVENGALYALVFPSFSQNAVSVTPRKCPPP